jgi:hypothetical protein
MFKCTFKYVLFRWLRKIKQCNTISNGSIEKQINMVAVKFNMTDVYV